MKFDDICYIGIEKVLLRGTADVIVEDDDGILVYDNKSELYMLACSSTEKGIKWFDYIKKDIDILNVCGNDSLAQAAFEYFGFKRNIKCYQVAYTRKEKMPVDPTLLIRRAEERDCQFICDNYHFDTVDEVKSFIKKNDMFVCEMDNKAVGFIGEHEEGSMGMLFVDDSYRRHGIATSLENYMINHTLDQNYIPFGQIICDNYKSNNLQKKLGLEESKKFVYWMF